MKARLELPPATLDWEGTLRGYVAMIDQTLLPDTFKTIRVRDVETMWSAIRRLAVRGAPAIGVAAAYGVVLGVRPEALTAASAPAPSRTSLRRALEKTAEYLATARPTAVNLFWALERMRKRGRERLDTFPARAVQSERRRAARAFLQDLLAEAQAIHREDRALCDAIGRHGATLLASGATVLTHCNAGALATGGSGTALSVIYAARRAGKRVAVYADETRPLLQGARLTAWELDRAGIDVTVICDGAAASVLGAGRVDCVVVGADRIAANGDVANKIGTYGVALLAHAHGIPFYVAAPSTTFDLSLASGAEIPIEERSPEEILPAPKRSQRTGFRAYNPAFDVTPARYVTALITEKGIIRPPYRRNIRRTMRA